MYIMQIRDKEVLETMSKSGFKKWQYRGEACEFNYCDFLCDFIMAYIYQYIDQCNVSVLRIFIHSLIDGTLTPSRWGEIWNYALF